MYQQHRKQLRKASERKHKEKLGEGEAAGDEERPEQNNENGRRFSQRGANWKGRKKSVVIKALQKEKIQMLQYLDKLQMPLEIKDEEHALLHE